MKCDTGFEARDRHIHSRAELVVFDEWTQDDDSEGQGDEQPSKSLMDHSFGPPRAKRRAERPASEGKEQRHMPERDETSQEVE